MNQRNSPFPYPNETSPAITPDNRIIKPGSVLANIRKRIQASDQKGKRPLVVYDLDATLFDNRPRILRILRDIVAEESHSLPGEAKRAVDSINPGTMKYRVKDTLRDAGLRGKSLLDHFFEGWRQRFFTNEYVIYDIPNSGAVEFVKAVAAAGAVTVYLTGRDTPGMRDGTQRSLETYGFPEVDGNKVLLITKPSFEMPDLDFKKEAIIQLRETGEVIAVFDNEPGMTNLFAEAFPEAMHIFLDTMHSPEVVPLRPEVLVMLRFTD